MYLEIDEGFDSHPKTVRLCRVMGDVNAGQYMIRIWAWACRSAQDGDISGMEAADVEKVAKYSPEDGRLFKALTEKWSPKFGPWIDVDGESVRLHGWDERQGAAIKRMEKNAARMRAARGRKVDERTNDVQSTCDARSEHVKSSPVQSSPDKARPDQRDSLARDPCASTTERAAHEDAQPQWDKPTGYSLLFTFGRLRREILNIQSAPGTETPKDANGKASSFADNLTEDEAKDVEATMRLALTRIRAGAVGWNDPRHAGGSFAFGAWCSQFADLREAVHGCAPKPKAVDGFGKPAARPRCTPVMER